MAVSKEQFFQIIAEPLRESRVTINGNEYRLRELNEEEGTKYELALYDAKGNWIGTNTRKALIAKMLIDDEGNTIVDSPDQLSAMPRGLAGALYSECLKLNRYEDKEIKDMIKNSEGVEG